MARNNYLTECDSLTTLKRRIQEVTDEKIVEFDGIELTTNKAIYTIFDSTVTRTVRNNT